MKARLLAIKEGRDPAAAVAALSADSAKEKKVSISSSSVQAHRNRMCSMQLHHCARDLAMCFDATMSPEVHAIGMLV